jgi:hypothetical protein
MQTQELDREEQWIAKYRAALDACPTQPSGFHQLALIWEAVAKLATLLPLPFGRVRRAIDRILSLKMWLTARLLQTLRSNNRQAAYIEPRRGSMDI